MYHEATEAVSLSVGVLPRECQISDCDGRYRKGEAFGQGFDSPQVHFGTSHRSDETITKKLAFILKPRDGCQLFFNKIKLFNFNYKVTVLKELYISLLQLAVIHLLRPYSFAPPDFPGYAFF